MFKRSCLLYLHLNILSVYLKHTGCIGLSNTYTWSELCHYYMCMLLNICAYRCVYSMCERITYTHGCELIMLIECIGVSDNNLYRSRHL